MTLAELQRRAKADGIVVIQREVSVPGPTLLARMKAIPYPTIAEIEAHPDQTFETRRFRYCHLLGSGLTVDELNRWRTRWPNHPLPSDLADLLLEINGIHLWADVAQGRAYIGIAPLAEWTDFASGLWAEFPELSIFGRLVISYHQNGDGSMVLDTTSGLYHWYDWDNASHPRTVGHSIQELFDWLWENARFDPRD